MNAEMNDLAGHAMGSVRGASVGSFRHGFATQTRIIGALLIRELNGRFGRENIGFLWFIGEPMMLATVITVLHLTQSSNHYSNDIAPAPFVIVAYTIFIIFRGIFNRSEGAIQNDQSILYHRTVSLFDMLLARGIVDAVGCFSVTVILLGVTYLIGLSSLPVRPLYLMSAAALMMWWSFALGMIASCVTYRNETLGRQVHVLSYFSIPISGAFWQMSWLPPNWRDVLQWFPMPLIFEQARYGMFRTASAQYVRPGYVIFWCAFLTYLGLLLLRRLRRRITL